MNDNNIKDVFNVMKGTSPEAAGAALLDATIGPFIRRGFRLIDSREGSLTGVTRPCFDVYMVGDSHPGALLRLEFKANMYRNIIGFDDCPRDTTVGTLTVRPWVQPYPGSGWRDYGDYDLPYPAFDIHTTQAGFNVLKLLRELFTVIDTEGAHELTRGFDTFSWESVRTYALYFEEPKHYEWELDDVEPAEFSPEQVKALNALIEAGKRLKA